MFKPGKARATKPSDEEDIQMQEGVNTQQTDNKLQKFDRGDYQIHVYVQYGRKFIHKKNGSISPLINVTVGTNSQFTDPYQVDVPTNSDDPTNFNKHFYFDLRDQTSEEIQNQLINIKILNRSLILRNDIIGLHEETVPAIYLNPDHKSEHCYYAFSNPDAQENIDQITGVMKISFQVTGPNDNAIMLTEQGPGSVQNQEIKLPPSITRRSDQLRIMIMETRDIELEGSSIKPFILCEFGGGQPCYTDVDSVTIIKSTKVAFINQVMMFPILVPVTNDRFILEVRKQSGMGEFFGSSDFVGQLEFSLRDILNQASKEPILQWCNIYGAHSKQANSSSQEAKLQNSVVKRASHYKGTMQLHISLEKMKEGQFAQKKVVQIDKDPVSQDFKKQMAEKLKQQNQSGERDSLKQKDFKKDNQYMCMIQLDQGISLPKPDIPYRVKISINKESWMSKSPKEKRGTYCRWSQRIKKRGPISDKGDPKYSLIPPSEGLIFTTPAGQKLSEQRVFVYLVEDDQEVCYWSDTLDSFTQTDPHVKWIGLLTNKSQGGPQEDYQAGMLGLQIQLMEMVWPIDAQDNSLLPSMLNKRQTKDDMEQYYIKTFKELYLSPKTSKLELPCWNHTQKLRMNAWKIRCFIFSCKNLPAGDEEGTSDPFISIWNPDGDSVKTQTVDANCSPIFMKPLEFYFDFDKPLDAPPVLLEVYDEDKKWNGVDHTFLGRAIIHLETFDRVTGNRNETDGAVNYCASQQDPSTQKIPDPKWHKFQFDTFSQEECGQVLCSFQVVQADFTFNIEVNQMRAQMYKMIVSKPFKVSINILGLRDLQSSGLLPIQRASVKVAVSSLFECRYRRSCEDIVTKPKQKGPNPNINYSIDFLLELPVDDKYCPDLPCKVYDSIFMFNKPDMIGSFSIDISKLIKEDEIRRTNYCRNLIILKMFLKNYLDSGVAPQSRDQQDQGQPGYIKLPNYLMDKQLNVWTIQPIPNEKVALKKEDRNDSGALIKNLMEQQQQRLKDLNSKMTIEEIRSSNVKAVMEVIKPALQQPVQEVEIKYMKVGYNNQQKIDHYMKMKEQFETLNQGSEVNNTKVTDEEIQEFQKSLKSLNDLQIINQILCGNSGNKAEQQITSPRATAMKESTKKQKESSLLIQDIVLNCENDFNSDNDYLNSDHFNLTRDLVERINTKPQAPIKKQRTDYLYRLQNETSLHYRRFINRELEECDNIFSEKVFENIPIKRGQSRGLSKSWLSSLLGSQGTDASGAQSNVQEIGYFKGQLSVEDRDKEQKTQINKQLDDIILLLNQIYTKIKPANQQSFKITRGVLDNHNYIIQMQRILDHYGLNIYSQMNFLLEAAQKNQIKELLRRNEKTQVFVYLIKGEQIASRDIGSESDPYLKVLHGDKVLLNDQANYQLDQSEPIFNRVLSFDTTFPGSVPLTIEMFDFDDLFGDDLIGRTTIDLEDRFYNHKWVALDEKPIEVRKLLHKTCQGPQGFLYMWLDIFQNESDQGLNPKKRKLKDGELPKQQIWQLETEPKNTLEIRLCVLSGEGLPNLDIEGTNDAYIKAYIERPDGTLQICETDTHYRCNNGKPSFNYRVKFNVETPLADNGKGVQLVLQAWDRDLLTKSDMICQWSLYLHPLVELVKESGVGIKFSKSYYEKNCLESQANGDQLFTPMHFNTEKPDQTYVQFESDKSVFDQSRLIRLFKPSSKDEKKQTITEQDSFTLVTHKKVAEEEYKCKIKLDLRIVTGQFADKNPVGVGRSDPNLEPYLTPPVNRLSLSDPLSFFTSMCSAELQRKLCCLLCSLVCIAIAIYCIPTLFTNLTALGFGKIFGLN